MKKNMTGDMEGGMHKEPNSKLVIKEGQVATKLQIMEPMRSKKKRI